MSKAEVLEKIKNAKNAHNANMKKALLLSEGIPLEGDPVPVGFRECAFGKWLYGDEAQVRRALGEAQYSEIETLHKAWHDEYNKIYDVYYKDGKKGFLGKLFGGRPKLSELEREKAKNYCGDLKEITWSLTKKMEAIEKRVERMPSDCC